MSNLLRQLCATLIVLLFVRCSQGFSVGYDMQDKRSSSSGLWKDISHDTPRDVTRDESDDTKRNFAAPRGKRQNILSQLTIGNELQQGLESVTDEEAGYDGDADKRAAWMRIGKRDVSNRYKISRQHTRLGKRSEEEEAEEAELTDSPFTRLARANFLRFGRSPFLRFGRSPSESTFLRIGRAPSDKTFLRIGRDQEAVKRFLRFGRSGSGSTWLRIGKRLNGLTSGNAVDGNSQLTEEEIQLLLDNKELLLKLLEVNPNLSEDDGYFAFPRQGRAMSFYFPRLGRSGEDDTKSAYCCTGGVRGVMSAGKGEFEICPRDQSCCPGLTERTKRYKDIYIMECAAMENDMENLRAFIGEE